MQIRSPKRLFLALAVVALLIGAWDYRRRASIREGEELETLIASMPIGITSAEADQILGTRPIRVYPQQSGVLISTVTMLTASNSQAAAHGPPQNYDLRCWERGDVQATVAIDDSGRVAGRWTWRPKR